MNVLKYFHKMFSLFLYARDNDLGKGESLLEKKEFM